MNANTLEAVDTLYLHAFQQSLAEDLMRARVSLKTHLRQSTSLAVAKDLPLSFRQRYVEISECLPLLIDFLGDMINDLEAGLPRQEIMQPVEMNNHEALVPMETKDIFSRLDRAESEILDVLKNVGGCLEAQQRSIVSWDDCARVKIHVKLKQAPERPCYDLDAPIDFFIHPFLEVDYFASKRRDADGRWPHYLIDEAMPIKLFPLIDDLWVEIQVHGDGFASWRAREENGFGKLRVREMQVSLNRNRRAQSPRFRGSNGSPQT